MKASPLNQFLDLFLNRPPARGLSFVRDRQGRKFWKEWSPEYRRVTLWYRRQRVGYVNLLWQGEPLVVLGDMAVEVPFQRQGLGTALIREVIELARRRPAAAIEGYVTPSDRDAWPRIFDWYGAFGFQKVDTPPPSFLPPGTVTIRRELASDRGSGA